MIFIKRIGPDPHANGAQSAACRGCPDIWELDNGDFAVIGIDITAAATPQLPPTAGCGPDAARTATSEAGARLGTQNVRSIGASDSQKGRSRNESLRTVHFDGFLLRLGRFRG